MSVSFFRHLAKSSATLLEYVCGGCEADGAGIEGLRGVAPDSGEVVAQPVALTTHAASISTDANLPRGCHLRGLVGATLAGLLQPAGLGVGSGDGGIPFGLDGMAPLSVGGEVREGERDGQRKGEPETGTQERGHAKLPPSRS